jgi:NAD(P)-dependent dehydrogenase (short-subunit alcohol dehydrogenase family)
MSILNNKVLIITGAKGGLGSYVTQACLNEGASVVGVSRSIANSDFNHPAFTAVPAELTSIVAATQVVERSHAMFGRIDGLIHLLGAFNGGASVEDTEENLLDQMIDINLRSTFYMLKAVLPCMRSGTGGRIVAVGSRAAVEAAPSAGAYAASKAALVSLIRTVAAENADRCISANIVLPGTMDTPANRKAMPEADTRRWVQPAQVANLILSLAGDSFAQVNGAAIPVYGRDQ